MCGVWGLFGFFFAFHVMSAFYSKTLYWQCFYLSVGYYSKRKSYILEVALTLRRFGSSLNYLEEKLSRYCVKYLCGVCVHRELCVIWLWEEEQFRLPCLKTCDVKVYFAWNYISQNCHWHEQTNVCCILTDTVPQAIIVCKTVSWCGIQGSDKHASI